MDAIETLEKDGLTANLYHDPEPTSPDDWDNLATFEHSAPFTFGEPIGEPERGWAVYVRSLTLFGDAVAAVPVRVDDYGANGLQINESDADNCNGVMFTTHEQLTKLCGDGPEYHTREWATEALRGELAVWSQYAYGDVYGYDVTDSSGQLIDSCWGFYGFEYAKEELAGALKSAVETVAEDKRNKAKGWALAHGLQDPA